MRKNSIEFFHIPFLYNDNIFKVLALMVSLKLLSKSFHFNETDQQSACDAVLRQTSEYMYFLFSASFEKVIGKHMFGRYT